MTFEEFERECEKQKERNEKFLEDFQNDLEAKGYVKKTIINHLNNAHFYINNFLLSSDPLPVEEGINMLDMFLGDFFIRKCMWSTPGTIKSTAASIKKFYKSMLDHGNLSESDYEILCDTIKINMEYWQEDCEMYNDGSDLFYF